MKNSASTSRSVSRASLASLAMTMLALLTASPPALAQSSTLTIMDVGGALNLLQSAIVSYATVDPGVKFVFKKSTAVELPNVLRTGQIAGRADIDLVLGGTDILAAGIDSGLWEKVLPEHDNYFPGLMERYLPEARLMQALASNQGIAVAFALGGPFLEYNPDKVRDVPKTPDELLTWCRAHPGRFTYARPANSGPGRTFLMGLPYLLGDSDPKDPATGWPRTWAFLKALDGCIDAYPSTTGALMKELGNGRRDITVSTTGWDINPRALGTVPKEYKVAAFDKMTWVNDSQYMMIPKGLSRQRLTLVLSLMSHLLKRQQQAFTYDTGYFYPGPVIKNVPYSLAPQASQDVLKNFGRVEFILWGLQRPHTQPLSAAGMKTAFRIWDDQVDTSKRRMEHP